MSTSIKKIFPLGFPWQTQDPFLFCVHHLDLYPKGNDSMGPDTSLAGRNIGQDFALKDGWRMYHGSKIPGFPYHPHRGFETITVAEQGFVDHTDSMGGAGRFGKGDVQWMTAGKGILHSEMFPLIHADKDNTLEIFQIWLNLPSKSKFVEPHFKMLWNREIPEIVQKDENGNDTVIRSLTGTLFTKISTKPTPDSWAANPENDVSVVTLTMQPNALCEIPASKPGINRTIYFFKGDSLIIENNSVEINHGIELNAANTTSVQAGAEECRILILQGRPIDEPVAQHGPFVMNTQEEIQEAFAEYRQTKFGGWPWPNEEFVHEKEKPRFALHSDGKVENPE